MGVCGWEDEKWMDGRWGATNDGVGLFPGKGYRYTASRECLAWSERISSELNRGQEEERKGKN
jgi:hypothetical protein